MPCDPALGHDLAIRDTHADDDGRAGRGTFESFPRAFVVAAAWVGVVVCGVDQLAAAEVSALTVLQASGLGGTVGALGGLLLGAVALALSRLSRRVAIIAWTLIGCAGGLVIGQQVGVTARLAGPDASLAAGVMLGLALAGAIAGRLLGITAATGAGTRRWGPANRRARTVGASALVLGFAAATLTDANAPILATHPAALAVLRASAIASLVLALLWVRPRRRRARARAAKMIPLLAWTTLASISWFTLGDSSRAQRTALASRPYSSFALTAAERATDWDGDGYSAEYGGGDCAAFDASIHPRAVEIPGNGVDENCIGGDGGRTRTTAPVMLPALPRPTDRSPVDVILISIDSLRADHMSTYGYERRTTPNFDRWSRGAVRFDRAYTSASLTSMAMTSLFRGLYPRRLTWSSIYESTDFKLYREKNPADLAPGEEIFTGFVLPIDDHNPTLAEILQRRGMTTVAVVDDGKGQFLEPRFGTARGFDRFVQIDDLAEEDRNDRGTVDTALGELAGLTEGSERFFLWVHVYGPHFPDERHEDAPIFGGFEDPVDRYDHEIAYMDAQVGRLLDALVAFETTRSLAVIVISDHGEHLFSHGRLHGVDLHERSIRVPLLIRAPGSSPGATQTMAHMVDVFPTILALTQTPGPAQLDGIDLSAMLRGESGPSRTLISELWRFDADARPTIDQIAAYDGESKLIVDLLAQTMLLSDASDKAEPPTNLIDRRSPEPLLGFIYAYLDEAGDGVTY